MTEASSADGLERALALCALAFSNAGREGLLDLLPDDLAAQVGDWLRRPEALTAGASSGLEVALLACMMASAPAVGAARLLAELPLAMQGEVTALLATSTQLSVARPLTRQERSLLEELRR